MHYVISFSTSKFDVRKEDENPINPIYGQSLLLWLKDTLKDEIEILEPDTEDWGWYSDIEWNGRSYMLGASSEVDLGELSSSTEKDIEIYWMFQVEKHRNFKEILLGKEKMTKNDPCLLFFKDILDAQPEFHSVEIE